MTTEQPRTSPNASNCEEKGKMVTTWSFWLGLIMSAIGAILGFTLLPVLDPTITNYYTNLVIVILLITIGALFAFLNGKLGQSTTDNCNKKQ